MKSMHYLLRHTVLCLALAQPLVAFAQSSTPATTSAAPAAPATVATQSVPQPDAAPAAQTANQPTAAAPATSSTPAAGNGTIGAPPAGKGQIVFFRDKKFVGSLISYIVREGTTEEAFVAMRSARDRTLGMPTLILPSIQVNIRAGLLPAAEDNGIAYLKIPLNAAPA